MEHPGTRGLRFSGRLPIFLFLLLAAAAGCESSSAAQSGPQPPCDAKPVPAYPDLDHSPFAKVWLDADLGRTWMPPSCLGWTAPGFSTLVAAAARFRYTGGVEGLRRRVAAISELAGMRYWSTTNRRWQTLIVDSYAAQGPAGERRKDFSADEVAEGRTLYSQQEDNLFGKAVFRMRIRSVAPGRLVFDTENATTIRYLFVPVVEPGDAQSVYFLERESGDVWRYYAIARTGRNATGFALAAGHEASLINRAVAFYRHLAGIPTDREPPAAR